MDRHAEIAGAGFAGLTVATLLAERGWSVRVHERAPEVREIGAGIFVHNNGLAVLEELGLGSELAARGVPLERERMRDEAGRILQDRLLRGDARIWAFPRQVLIEALRAAAVERGAEIVTDSFVERATPEGALLLAGGGEARADLVVGADGHRSRVRESLGLTRTQRELDTVSTRYLLEGREFTPAPTTTEHWSGERRVALAACAPDRTYVYMACPAKDEPGGRQPLDVRSWTESFPHLEQAFAALREADAVQGHYSLVSCEAWSRGAAVLLGDAAHALAPTLGQGTNLAMVNARTLVSYLERGTDVATAATRWERDVRWVTEATQRWASRYDLVTKHWPSSLSAVRAAIIWGFGRLHFLNDRMRVADRHAPDALGVAPG